MARRKDRTVKTSKVTEARIIGLLREAVAGSDPAVATFPGYMRPAMTVFLAVL